MSLPPEALPLPHSLVSGATVLPERHAILPHLPKGAVIAEVGVGFGDFSASFIDICQPSRFFAIDNFRLHEERDLWGRTPAEVFGDGTHRQAYERRFSGAIESGHMEILEGPSAECLETLQDESLDVIYIDADHRYEFVRRDLSEAARKIRADGWIIVNDYIMVPTLGAETPYGVVNATHEFMLEHGWSMRFIALHTRMFCDVALRRSGLVKDVEQEAAEMRGEIAALRASTSWRVTRPLRAASRLFVRR